MPLPEYYTRRSISFYVDKKGYDIMTTYCHLHNLSKSEIVNDFVKAFAKEHEKEVTEYLKYMEQFKETPKIDVKKYVKEVDETKKKSKKRAEKEETGKNFAPEIPF